MDVVVEKLVQVPLFAALDPGQLKRIARICERQFVAPGHTLIEAGSKPDAAYLCLDDAIACETVVDGEVRREPVPEGSTLVEFAMIVETEAASRFVVDDHARVIRICRAKLMALLETDSDLAAALSDGLAARLADMAARMREAAVPFFVPSPAIALGPNAGGSASETGATPAQPDETREDERRSA